MSKNTKKKPDVFYGWPQREKRENIVYWSNMFRSEKEVDLTISVCLSINKDISETIRCGQLGTTRKLYMESGPKIEKVGPYKIFLIRFKEADVEVVKLTKFRNFMS